MALSQGVTVIPVLVDGATMPESTELPTELQGLSTRNAVTIGLTTFSLDIERLVGVIMQRREISATPRRIFVLAIVTIIPAVVMFALVVIGSFTGSSGLFIAGIIMFFVFGSIFVVTIVVAIVWERLRRKRG